MNVISRARLVLGYGARGQERLAYSAQGYRLAPEVTSDWARFETLVATARLAPPPDAISALRYGARAGQGRTVRRQRSRASSSSGWPASTWTLP